MAHSVYNAAAGADGRSAMFVQLLLDLRERSSESFFVDHCYLRSLVPQLRHVYRTIVALFWFVCNLEGGREGGRAGGEGGKERKEERKKCERKKKNEKSLKKDSRQRGVQKERVKTRFVLGEKKE